MIGVKLHGRLGNQMFQYAFATAAAMRLDTTFFYLPPDQEKISIDKYFKLKRWGALNNSLKAWVWKNKVLTHKYENKRYTNLVDSKAIKKELVNNALYSGFFQSLDFFVDYQELIKKCFSIKPIYQKAFHLQYSHLKNRKYAVVHVRRTDYKTHGNKLLGSNDVCLPDSYYFSCIEKIREQNDVELFFISDDIESVKDSFGHIPNTHFVENNEIVDFLLLVNADIAILSNSTFAWWGAFLNEKKEKKVYAPKNWLGFKSDVEYPVNIMSINFDWVDVVCEDLRANSLV